MASIYKRKRVWWVSYYIGKKRVRKKVGRDEEQAKILKKEIELKLARKQMETLPDKIKIEDYIEQFLRTSTPYWKEKTLINNKGVLDNLKIFLARMGVAYIHDISQSLIEEYVAQRKAEISPRTKKNISDSTINYELKIIKRLLSKAEELNCIYRNPAKKVKLLKPIKKHPKFLSPEEIKLIFESDATESDKSIYAVMLFTGIRPGEAINLRWGDINFSGREIIIAEKADWSPKNRLERAIPMSNEIYNLLRRIDKKPDKGQHVFLNSSGRKYTIHGLETNFKRLMKNLNIKRATPHTFRHTFASLMVMKYGNLRTIQEILGHSSIKTTEIYAHLSNEHIKEMIKDFGASLGTFLGTNTLAEPEKKQLTA
jgi:integrase